MITPFLFQVALAAPETEAVEAEQAPVTEAIEAGADARTQAEVERDELRAEMAALRREVEELRSRDAQEAEEADEPEARRGSSRTGFGESVRVAVDEEVDEVVSFGDDVEVAGHVLGDAVSFGGNVIVHPTGVVGGDAVSFGGRVVVDDGGAIRGDRVAMGIPSAGPVVIEPSGPVGAANLTATSPSWSPGEMLHTLYRKLVWLMSIAGAGVLVVGLFPQRVARVATDVEARPVRAAVVGTLATGLLLLFSLLFTVVTLGLGLPISLLLVGVLGIAWLFGFVGLCQAVGDRLPFEDRPHGRWIAFLVGIVLVSFLSSLPWVGWLVVMAASVLGVGSALSTRFGGRT
ncbi:MAG: hypothetical protein H6735_11675 [Alphaproteobacteria bacterium]|nr:hypothetical protein [Alphaproteobacteria bacterium]